MSFSDHFSTSFAFALRWIVIDVIFRSLPVFGAPGRSPSCFPTDVSGIVKLWPWWQSRPMTSQPPSYHGYRFPPVISHAVWLYHRFCLSFRDAVVNLTVPSADHRPLRLTDARNHQYEWCLYGDEGRRPGARHVAIVRRGDSTHTR